MRLCLHSNSRLRFQSAQIPVAFLKYLHLPRKLQREPLKRRKVSTDATKDLSLISDKCIQLMDFFKKRSALCWEAKQHELISCLAPSKSLFKHLPISSAPQEADSDRPEDLHPAQTCDYGDAAGSNSSHPAAQNDHHPAPADHCAACGQANSSQYPTSAPFWWELTLQHVFSINLLYSITMQNWTHRHALQLIFLNIFIFFLFSYW